MDELSVVEKALTLRDPAERRAFLGSVCGTDRDMLARIEDQLRAREQAELRQPDATLAGSNSSKNPSGSTEHPSPTLTSAAVPMTEQPGVSIGPYKLREQIGEGGMGLVFVAEQSEPVRRRVALKVIKPGMDSRQVLARFEAEREALSLMDHPNIAKVLDAGATASGRPYFVMEFVRGQPITDYCDQRQFTPRERLELFLAVCRAIQHAHQKGVIHRDIKPSNVLIAEIDQQAVCKVIDFGVSKAVGRALTEKTLFTGFGQIVGTLEYMSPEQATGSPVDIDTRSDIYSLGVLLYQLLTGSTPIDPVRLSSVGWDEKLRLIREEEPPRPSTRLGMLDTLSTVAANRKTEPAKLSGLMRGELDWIVLKAMEKDRNRRYETANSLAADIQRYLNDQPVEARPPSNFYRFGKFYRRHRGSVLATTAVAAALLIGLIAATGQSIRAWNAEKQVRLTLNQVRRLADSEADARRIAEKNFRLARNVVDDYLTRVANDERLKRANSPLRKQLLQDALKYYEAFLSERHDDTSLSRDVLHAKFQIASVAEATGAHHEAIEAYQQVIASLDQGLQQNPNDEELADQRGTCHHNLGLIYLELDDYEQAQANLQTALQQREQIVARHGGNHAPEAKLDLIESRHAMAMLCTSTYRPQDAIPLMNDAIAALQPLVADDPQNAQIQSQLGALFNQLATAQMLLDRTDQAIQSLEEARQHQQLAVAQQPNNVTYIEFLANHCFNLGVLFGGLGRNSDAVDAMTAAHKSYLQLTRLDPSISEWQFNLARSSLELSQLNDHRDPAATAARWRLLIESESILQNQLDITPNWNNGLSVLGQVRHEIALSLQQQGRLKEATAKRLEVVESLRRLTDSDPVNEANHRHNLARSWRLVGELHVQLHESAPAEKAFSQSELEYGQLLAAHPEERKYMAGMAQSLQAHGALLADQDRHEAAEQAYRQANDLLEKLAADGADAVSYAVQRGGVCCNLANQAGFQGRLDEALLWYARAIETLRKVVDAHPDNDTAAQFLLNSHHDKITTLIKAGDVARAIQACTEALEQLPLETSSTFQLRRAYYSAKHGATAEAVGDLEALTARVEFDATAMHNVAATYALCAEQLKGANPGLSETYVQNALQWLARTLETRQIAVQEILEDEDFASLRERPEFQKLVQSIR